jgi:UDP-glucose 4-epimerase
MRKILITGANSYIGSSFEKWISQWSEKYSAETVDMIDDTWREKNFSEYDVVFHVAGIAHVSADPKMKELYYKINRDLAIETAEKARNEGVKQFIFMSSIIIYGNSTIKGSGIIYKDTTPRPANFYGDSKLQAEDGIRALNGSNFKVVILRPPMIYGKGSKGNYPKLAKAARKLPVFPDIDNQRSMLFIDNLCEFIRLMIENEETGVFFPQNNEYANTSEIVKMVAEANGKNIRLVKLFNPVLKLLSNRVGIFNKAFGNLVYDKEISEYKENYRISSLQKSIILTENI